MVIALACNSGKLDRDTEYKFVEIRSITMYRLTQILRNSFIALKVCFIRSLVFLVSSWLVNQRFNFLSQLLGFTESQYFTENEAAATKPNKSFA